MEFVTEVRLGNLNPIDVFRRPRFDRIGAERLATMAGHERPDRLPLTGLPMRQWAAFARQIAHRAFFLGSEVSLGNRR